jgi:hypothetical protein
MILDIGFNRFKLLPHCCVYLLKFVLNLAKSFIKVFQGHILNFLNHLAFLLDSSTSFSLNLHHSLFDRFPLHPQLLLTLWYRHLLLVLLVIKIVDITQLELEVNIPMDLRKRRWEGRFMVQFQYAPVSLVKAFLAEVPAFGFGVHTFKSYILCLHVYNFIKEAIIFVFSHSQHRLLHHLGKRYQLLQLDANTLPRYLRFLILSVVLQCLLLQIAD